MNTAVFSISLEGNCPLSSLISYQVHHENQSVIQSLRRIVVLLKHGVLEAVECLSDEVFLLARIRGAGICGVFDDWGAAEGYIQKHALPCSVAGVAAPSRLPNS